MGWPSFYKLQPAGEIELETLGNAALVRVRAIRPCVVHFSSHSAHFCFAHNTVHSQALIGRILLLQFAYPCQNCVVGFHTPLMQPVHNQTHACVLTSH
jgi:hypothetical protein